jgi:isoleucyl-tRNA synthetase
MPGAGGFIEDSRTGTCRSRRRFWKAEEDSDKVAAYLTLYECLVTTTQLLAPITPFRRGPISEPRASVDEGAGSVHLCDWPVVDSTLISPALHDETALVMRMVNLGRAAREKAQIRVRQPLATLYVRVGSQSEREALERLGDQVLEELNVKRLELPLGSILSAGAHADVLAPITEVVLRISGPAALRRHAGARAQSAGGWQADLQRRGSR